MIFIIIDELWHKNIIWQIQNNNDMEYKQVIDIAVVFAVILYKIYNITKIFITGTEIVM
jgi:hypothetical protein